VVKRETVANGRGGWVRRGGCGKDFEGGWGKRKKRYPASTDTLPFSTPPAITTALSCCHTAKRRDLLCAIGCHTPTGQTPPNSRILMETPTVCFFFPPQGICNNVRMIPDPQSEAARSPPYTHRELRSPCQISTMAASARHSAHFTHLRPLQTDHVSLCSPPYPTDLPPPVLSAESSPITTTCTRRPTATGPPEPDISPCVKQKCVTTPANASRVSSAFSADRLSGQGLQEQQTPTQRGIHAVSANHAKVYRRAANTPNKYGPLAVAVKKFPRPSV